MKLWHAALLSAGIAFLAFRIGYMSGTRDCPERIAYRIHQDAESKRLMAEIMAEPTGREAVCDQVFDLVYDENRRDRLDEQQEMDAAPIDWRD